MTRQVGHRGLYALPAVALLVLLLGGLIWRSAHSTHQPTGPAVPPDAVQIPPVTGRLGETSGTDAEIKNPQTLPDDHPLRKIWPRGIESAALYPNGNTVALYDGEGVYLTDPSGKRKRRLDITLRENLTNEMISVSFLFRPDGKRVAVLTTLIYGEPMGAFIERLWTADSSTGRVRMLREWMDRVQGTGPITAERKPDGWTDDGKSVIVTGVVYDGLEMPSDAHVTGTERVLIEDEEPGSPR